MVKTPLISVIVPVHNVQDHVAACLGSVSVQTLDDFECIVVDDGSTDQSRARIETEIAGDPRFRLITRPNGGLSAARNTGLDAARGGFIAFVDSDDRIRPDFLKRMWEALEDTRADWVSCAIRSVSDRGWRSLHSSIHSAPKIADASAPIEYELKNWEQAIDHFPSAWNKLYRRKLIKGLRFREGLVFEDHEFFLRAAARTTALLHLPEPLYHQTRDRAGQITGQDSDLVFEQIKVLEHLKEAMPGKLLRGKRGGEAAFAQLACRLIGERSVVLRSPLRRREFLRQANTFLDRNRVTDRSELAPHLALELQGKLPLTVLVQCFNRIDALSATLQALEAQFGPGFETLVFCPYPADEAAVRTHLSTYPMVRLLTREEGAAPPDFASALAHASGETVLFLQAGHMPGPSSLANWTDALLEAGCDVAFCAFEDKDGAGPTDRLSENYGKVVTLDEPLNHPLGATLLGTESLRLRLAANPGSDQPFEARALAGVDKVAAVGTHPIRLFHPIAQATTPSPGSFEPVQDIQDGLWMPLLAGNAQRLNFEADLGVSHHANVSLNDAETKDILFHASLRLQSQTLVCNRRILETWDSEATTPLALAPRKTRFSILINGTDISIEVDGKLVWQSVVGHRYLNLARASVFDVYGAFTKAEALPDLAARPMGLDSLWQVRAFVPDENATLHLEDSETPLPLRFENIGEQVQAVALLPGRHWARVPAGQPLRLALRDSDGEVLARAEFSRQTLADRLSRLAVLGQSPIDPLIATHALEHVHHGKLWALMSEAGRDYITTLSNRLKVTDQLPPSTEKSETETPAASAPVRHLNPNDIAYRRFWNALGDGSRPVDPVALARAELKVLEPEHHTYFVVGLTEFFCTGDQVFADLEALAEEFDIRVADMKAHDHDLWLRAALLPWQYRAGDFQRIEWSFEALKWAGERWIMTPPIAWVLGRALDLPAAHREGVVFRGLELLAHQANTYFGRAYCVDLARSVARLVVGGWDVSIGLTEYLETLCLRVYALSDEFWSALPRDATIPARLEHARRVFQTVTDEAAPTDDRLEALDILERMGAQDAPRYRRELFGPDEGFVDEDGAIEAASLLRSGRVPGPVALRYLAHPGAQDPSPEIEAIARDHVSALYPDVPRAPDHPRQMELGRSLATLAKNATQGSDLPDGLLADLEHLATARSRWLGFGLAIRLLKSLPNGHARQNLSNWMRTSLSALSPATRREVADAPAIRSATLRLREGLGTALAPLLPDLTCAEHLNLPGALRIAPVEGIHDALVLVFSCQAYLDTRIPPMREGWLSALADLGIPYLVVVGDGDGRLEGDVLFLDAPDDYEGLPQKTLAALEWVEKHTDVGHIVKVDDDCFINVPVWFGGLSYQKFDFYGRRLTRVPGQMDRGWHLQKSRSERGRMELDKSPEPSEYADGGSGYALSRHALSAALEVARSPYGQRLIQVSFMEDKLLGDLLARAGFRVEEEDYRVSIRRRTFGDAMPVGAWHNSFFASNTAQVSLVHLDTPVDQVPAFKASTRPGLRPARIWPSFEKPRIGYNSNALELLTPQSRLADARAADVALVGVVRNEQFMLPHFLDHYRKLGVTAFLLADNLSTDGTREYLAAQPDVTLFSVDTEYNRSQYGVAWQQAMMSDLRLGKWSIVADADELLVWQNPQTQSLPDLVAGADDAQAFRIFMLDMYPEGSLEDATFDSGDPFAEAGFVDREPFLNTGFNAGPFSDQACWVSALRHRLIAGSRPNLFTAQKLALLRYHPGMRLSAGLHFVGNARLAAQDLFFGHFKYNAAFRAKAQTEVARGQHFNDAEEYRRYLALVSEGRDVIYDAAISVPWTECAFVRERLSQTSE